MDGIIVINKEKGCTSNDVVKRVKKLLNTRVGHTGTLDPNATGVLPLLLGNATKISKYLINHDKEYEAVLQLGKKTTTADIEGKIIEEKDVNLSKLSAENIEEVLKTFIGKQSQMPPIYSAIKINGRKLYDYARKGQEVEIKPREIEIYSISLIHIDLENIQIRFNVKCSKGTYIRSLCEDIAIRLGTVGYMKELNRISVGEFNIKDSITVDKLEEQIKSKEFSSIIKIEELFVQIPKIELAENNIKKYLNGVKIDIKCNNNGPCKVYLEGKFIGIGNIMNGKLKRDVVLNI